MTPSRDTKRTTSLEEPRATVRVAGAAAAERLLAVVTGPATQTNRRRRSERRYDHHSFSPRPNPFPAAAPHSGLDRSRRHFAHGIVDTTMARTLMLIPPVAWTSVDTVLRYTDDDLAEILFQKKLKMGCMVTTKGLAGRRGWKQLSCVCTEARPS